MTTKIFKNLHWLILGALTALLLYSCVYENIPSTSLEGDGEAMVKFSIKLPAAAIPATKTRALSSGDENDVHEIDILVFEKNKGEFVYRTGCSGSAITGTEQTKTFTVMLRKGEFDIVMLANARSAISGKSFTGKGKDAALEMIEVSMPAGGKWIATATDIGYKPFPMWGDMGNTTIDETTDLTGNNAIALTRMVARVDVTVPSTVDKFKLTGVDVYNYNSKGILVPTATGTWDGSKAVYPNVPTGTGVLGPISYGINTVTDNSCVSEIYIFEAENHSDVDHIIGKSLTDRTCLVVAGIYDADDNEIFDETPTFYRIDFSTGSGMSQTFLDVLRNHKYIFSITKVSGPGYETSQIAFETGPFNIEANVLEWNEANMGDVVFDGQNYLGVSPSEFSLYRDAKANNKFTVKTDVTTGWIYTGVTDALTGGTAVTWIKNVAPALGNGDEMKQTVSFDVEENTTGSIRTAYIHIKAGRLEFPIEVTQGITPDIGVWILDGNGISEIPELVFSSAAGVQPDAQSFIVRWSPASASVYVSKTPAVSGGTQFGYASTDKPGEGTMTSITDVNGEKMLTIKPLALTEQEISANTFLEKASKVDFSVSSGGVYATKSVFLRQVNFNTVADVADYYMLNGGNYSFTVRSNTAWVVKEGSLVDSFEILDLSVDITSNSGGYNTSATLGSGNTFSFKLRNDTEGGKNGKTATLTLTDPTGRMSDVLVTIKGATCGMNGIAVAQQIGTNGYDNDASGKKTYLTHMYGGKCWMVQNLREGSSYSATNYNNTPSMVNGNYYTWDQARITNNACPVGWSLPNEAEFNILMGEVNVEKTGKGKWWNVADNNAFAGLYGDYTWGFWGSRGVWWSNSTSAQYFFVTSTSNMSGPYTDSHTGDWYSVRCVRNQ